MAENSYISTADGGAGNTPESLNISPVKEGLTMPATSVTTTDIETQDALLPADPYVSMIERVAMDPDADLEKLERMLELKDKHEAKQAKAAADMAFAQASAEFPAIPLNGKNDHNGKSYALLKDIIAGTRPVLARHGLALSFSTEVTDKDVVVTAELSHKDGYTKRNSLPLPRDTGAGRNAVQAVGSSQTYGQRYTAQAILGLSLGEDAEDDGAGAIAASSISAEQFVVLRDLIEQTETDLVKFFTAHGAKNPEAETLENFPASKFETAKSQLERKLAKMGGGNV